MFIRRALAVSLSLLFVLSLFFQLKTVMAASPAAPASAPPAVVPPAVPSADNKQSGASSAVGADGGKQTSASPAGQSDDNKQPGASPSPAGPKAEAGLSQEPKQAVSPEAEQKKPEAQQPSVAAPPVANEEKKNDSSAAKVQVPAKVKAAVAAASSDDDLPPWREKLDEKDVMQMSGCEAIADHEHKQIIIRPKNGAKEGVICFLSSANSFVSGDFRSENETLAMLAVIQSTEGYTLKFEKRIYLFNNLAPWKGDITSFLNFVPEDDRKYSGRVREYGYWEGGRRTQAGWEGQRHRPEYKIKSSPSTLASLGNIADVNTNFLGSLFYFLAHTRIGTENLNILAKKKYKGYASGLVAEGAFEDMKCLTGYADFSNFQTGTNTDGFESMRKMFKGSGADDFVLNFSNKKLYKYYVEWIPNEQKYKIISGRIGCCLHVDDAFKDFKGVLIANNWENEIELTKETGEKIIYNYFNEWRSPDQLFGVKKEDAEKGYSLSSLVVTDNPELLKIRKNSKYYKKITLSYLDQKEELELPAIYDSRITPTGENDTNQPASADYMKIVKYQVDKAIHAKVAEIKRKCGLPDNFPLEAVPTKAISSTPTSLFQEYRLPIKINELMISPQKQVVCENAAIEKININFIYADNKKLQRFHLDTAALEQQLPQGLKLHVAGNNLLNSGLLHFFPLAVGFNGSPLLQVLTQPVATISGTIQCDDSKVTKKKVDGKEEYYVYLTISGTAEYADGSSGVLNQKAEIQVLPNIPVGNKPETSSTLGAYLMLAGALSVILTGRKLAKK